MKILVTGANGQLGRCIKDLALETDLSYQFVFTDRNTLDITNSAAVNALFEHERFDYCINAAAYTNVEGAEKDEVNAFKVNAEGVKHLAEACRNHNVVLIQISTDYVFSGEKKTPYIETDETGPLNVYGASKLKGEQYVQEICEKFYIVRTSWVYSQYGHNFMKSILRLTETQDRLKITVEQKGCPTNANDLAHALLVMVASNNQDYGTYHFCNDGEATWYDFAKAIVEYGGFSDKTTIEKTDYYPTFAKRPNYSVLCTDKIQATFSVTTINWKNSLKELIHKY